MEMPLVPATEGGSADGDAPFWPDETAEVAFLSETKDRSETTTQIAAIKTAPAGEEVEAKISLPPLEELVKRIPTEVRDVLEELFRAKFVHVKRVPKKSLKS